MNKLKEKINVFYKDYGQWSCSWTSKCPVTADVVNEVLIFSEPKMARLKNDMALDLSCAPLDLSLKRVKSNTQQFNGTANFSFCRKRAAYAVSKAAGDVPDVLEWNDSLLRISSVIKLSEILDDWATDEETDIERVPWRFKVPVEPVRNYSDFYAEL